MQQEILDNKEWDSEFWDVTSCSSAYGHAERIFDVQFCPADSSLIATASEDMTVRIWRSHPPSGDFKQARHLLPAPLTTGLSTSASSLWHEGWSVKAARD